MKENITIARIDNPNRAAKLIRMYSDTVTRCRIIFSISRNFCACSSSILLSVSESGYSGLASQLGLEALPAKNFGSSILRFRVRAMMMQRMMKITRVPARKAKVSI